METKKIIEELLLERDAEMVHYSTEEAINSHKERCDYLIGLLERAKDGGWIPVETELPKESVYDGYVEPSEPVLVFTKYNECRVSRYWGNRRNKRDYYDWVDIKYQTDEVIAWMPLPSAPYQKGE